MNATYTITGLVLVLMFVVYTIFRIINRCEKCGSWNNRVSVRISKEPKGYRTRGPNGTGWSYSNTKTVTFETSQQICNNCGHILAKDTRVVH